MRHGAMGRPGRTPGNIGRGGAAGGADRFGFIGEKEERGRSMGPGFLSAITARARRHGAVADHGDHVVGFAGEIPGDRPAQCGRARRRGARRTEWGAFALRPFGKAGKSPPRPPRWDAIGSAAKESWGYVLMAQAR